MSPGGPVSGRADRHPRPERAGASPALGTGLTVAQRPSLDAAVAREPPGDAATAFLDMFVRSLRRAVRTVYTLSAGVVVLWVIEAFGRPPGKVPAGTG